MEEERGEAPAKGEEEQESFVGALSVVVLQKVGTQKRCTKSSVTTKSNFTSITFFDFL